MKKSNNKKGFTLVELVIVVAVIAILSAILIPTIGTVIKDAKDAAVKSDLRTVITNKMIERDDDGNIVDNEPVAPGYFFYKETADAAYTYVLYWNGSEVALAPDGNITIDVGETSVVVGKASKGVPTMETLENYTVTPVQFEGKFYTLSVSAK